MVAPLVQESGSRIKRALSTIAQRRFATKVEPSQETQQGLFEAELEQDRLQAQQQARIAEQSRIETERITESKRQSEALAIERRRERKKAEPSFIETLFGK